MTRTATTPRSMFDMVWLIGKSYEEAVTALERCIRVKPDYSAAYQALTVALYKSGQIDRSSQIGRKGIEISTANGDVMVTKQLEHFLGQIQ